MPNSLVWWKLFDQKGQPECLPCKIKTFFQNLSRQIFPKKRVVFCNICLVFCWPDDFLPHSGGLSPKRTRHPSFADPFLAGNVASVLDVRISMKKNSCTCHQGFFYMLPFQSSSFLGKSLVHMHRLWCAKCFKNTISIDRFRWFLLRANTVATGLSSVQQTTFPPALPCFF